MALIVGPQPTRHILSIQALHSLNGTPGEIWTHTILVLSQTPHASWATGAYGMGVCHYFSPARMPTRILLPLRLGCDKSFIFTTFKDTWLLPGIKFLPDYYFLTPPIALAAVFHQLRFTLAEVNQLKRDWKDSNLRSTVNSRKS